MMYWPLMKETITFKDKMEMVKFILTTNRFTNGPKVREFEKQWSQWLGANHSLFVSSGSTANSLLISSVKEMYGLKDGDKVLVPSCTWMTNVAPVIQCGFTPIFCDVNLTNFSFCEDDIKYISKQHPDIKMIFVTHLLGISANVEKYQEYFPQALILEDVCESHGVENKTGIKRGSCSLGSTFSFYFGHHMTTIEGGMVSTNNEDLYELMRMKRSHGLARESSHHKYIQYCQENPNVAKEFLFMTDGYNFRNHEICAVLGSSQLKRIDSMICKRRENYKQFCYFMNKNSDKFYPPEYHKGNSSFCFPIICKNTDKIQKIKQIFDKNKIEYRPIVSGNLLRHPAFKNYKLCTNKEKLNVEIIHNNGVYIGNNHFVTKNQMNFLQDIIDNFE